MTAFSFYLPNTELDELEKVAIDLRIHGVELAETHLKTSPGALRRARFASGLRYVALRLNDSLESYCQERLKKIALWCEANEVEAIIMARPGNDAAAAGKMLEWLDCFRVNIVFENRVDSFLRTAKDMDTFFRANRQALLSYYGAEMVSQRTHPFSGALDAQTYRKQLYMIRVQDRCFNGADALPCEGDADLAECFSAAVGFGRHIWASLTPYGGYDLEVLKTNMGDAFCRI